MKNQQKQYNIHKAFLFCNYILLSLSSSCIFLTLSLNLFPSICGFFLILLHAFTIAGAVSASASSSSSLTTITRWYSAHMVVTVLTAIFQGSVSVMVFTRTEDFLAELKSYVREEDACVILKLCGGLAGVIFLLEWVVLTLAFFLKCYSDDGDGVAGMRSGKVQSEEELKDWP
ncbi:unnamed protein product [Vicia faba]|uniref:Uncharacterized protein n=1 Tax=Vicia faba TaxID=3906 RepID=A0AAV1BB40_VICFA|nr:unnamed protein product [Vicia faba]